MECNICVEKYNKSTHIITQCSLCDFTACRKCVETYILNNIETLQCMSCRGELDINYLYKNHSIRFIKKTYRHAKNNYNYDREKLLLIDTYQTLEENLLNDTIKVKNHTKYIRNLSRMSYAAYKNCSKICKCVLCSDTSYRYYPICNYCEIKCCYGLNCLTTPFIYLLVNRRCIECGAPHTANDIVYLFSKMTNLRFNSIITGNFMSIYNTIKLESKDKIEEIQSYPKKLVADEVYFMGRENRYKDCIKYIKSLCEKKNNNITNNKKNVSIKKVNMVKCANTDCRGYIKDWYCSLCKQTTCKMCNNIIEEGHICNDDEIKTVELLRESTEYKNCPKCTTLISKISGCDQMFCVKCATAFSWKTLKIDNGRIHNPHYFEWITKDENKDKIRDSFGVIRDRDVHRIACDKDTRFRTILQQIEHFRYLLRNNEHNNTAQKLYTNRINYLKNMYDEETFRKNVIKYKIKLDKIRDHSNIIRPFIDIAWHKIVDGLFNNTEPEIMINELYDIANKYNSELHIYSLIYEKVEYIEFETPK